MRRGRPPYPGVLTPREQEILILIREGLTNDQIAHRLGISESGARYHVSEILSKLGVESRYEAAQWAGEVAAPRRAAAPALLGKFGWAGKYAAAGVIGAAMLGLVALAIGVVVSQDRAGSPRAPMVETLAGTQEEDLQGPFFGYRDGPASQAVFDRPVDVAADRDGNVYVADQGSGRLRVIRPSGTVESLAGPGEVEIPQRAPGLPSLPGMPPPGTHSGFFHQLAAIDVDGQGSVFIAGSDTRMYRLEPSGSYSVIAGGDSPPRTAPFTEGPFGDFKNLPLLGPANTVNVHGTTGLAALPDGSLLLVGDFSNALQGRNQMVRKLTPDGQMVLVAGSEEAGFRDGVADQARFSRLSDIAVDDEGNAYVTDRDNHRVRKISPDGQVTTLAGSGERGFADGPATQARFADLQGIAVAANGTVYVTDSGAVRSISPDGAVKTIAGAGNAASALAAGYADGPGYVARFNHPMGIAVEANGSIVVADSSNNVIRRIQFVDDRSVPAANPAPVTEASLVDGTVNVYVYDGVSLPAQPSCIDIVGDMVPASAWISASRKLASCTLDFAFNIAYQLLQGEDGLFLGGARMRLITSESRQNLSQYPPGVHCLDLRDKLVTTSQQPSIEMVNFASMGCLLEPPVRGGTGTPISVWANFATTSLPATPLAPDVPCWQLARYNSAGGEGTTTSVPCLILVP